MTTPPKPFHGLIWPDTRERGRTVFIERDEAKPQPWRLYEDHPNSGPVCMASYKYLTTAVEKALFEVGNASPAMIWFARPDLEEQVVRRRGKRNPLALNMHWLAGAYARIRHETLIDSAGTYTKTLKGTPQERAAAENLFVQGFKSLDVGIALDKVNYPLGIRYRKGHQRDIPDHGKRKK